MHQFTHSQTATGDSLCSSVRSVMPSETTVMFPYLVLFYTFLLLKEYSFYKRDWLYEFIVWRVVLLNSAELSMWRATKTVATKTLHAVLRQLCFCCSSRHICECLQESVPQMWGVWNKTHGVKGGIPMYLKHLPHTLSLWLCMCVCACVLFNDFHHSLYSCH